jgi:SAM-dependent MidA family methyltransferase
MTDKSADWPEPDDDAQAVSARLSQVIRRRVEQAGGWLPFSEYMHAALYEPELGYYAAGSRKIGAGGDFVTAPELGDFLARAIAATAMPILARLPRASVLEIGAGTGALARDLLTCLDAAGCAHVEYVIFEPSADLRERQQHALRRFGSRVKWIDDLAGADIEGVVVANEVADALPVERFRIQGGRMFPCGVGVQGGRFVWSAGPRSVAWVEACAPLEAGFARELPEAYESEWCPALAPWVSSLAGSLRRGAVFVIDYGLPRREYYHPDRTGGTLMCHYRHRAHSDPFFRPGLQDITAWVDFSACAEAAESVGMNVLGYTIQGAWLVETLLCDGADLSQLEPKACANLKTLLLPGEMGERFKILLLGKGIDHMELAGRDLRNRL